MQASSGGEFAVHKGLAAQAYAIDSCGPPRGSFFRRDCFRIGLEGYFLERAGKRTAQRIEHSGENRWFEEAGRSSPI